MDDQGPMDAQEIAALFERLPIPLYATSREGRFLAANAALRDVLGVSDPLTADAEDTYHDHAERERFIADLDQRPEIGLVDWEQVFRSQEGLQWIQPLTRVVRDADGRVMGLEGGFVRSRRDGDEVDLDQWLRMILEHTNDAVLLLDPVGRVLWANRQGRRTLGITEASLRGRPLLDDLVDTGMPIGERLLDTPLRAELRFSMQGRPRHYWVNLEAHLDHLGNPAFYSVIARDLAPSDEAARRLADAVVARERLLSTVAHEIRTPLSSVLGFALELTRVLEEAPGNEEHVEMASLIAEQATDITRIVTDLVETSAGDRLRTQITDIGLADVARSAIESSGAGFELPVRGDGVARGDSLRVRQVLRNLITNALRYGRPPVEVEIEVTERAQISVIDHGDGIPEWLEEQLYEPFTTHGGAEHTALGLGLSISRTLARQMDGDLTHTRTDSATRFTLELPVP